MSTAVVPPTPATLPQSVDHPSAPNPPPSSSYQNLAPLSTTHASSSSSSSAASSVAMAPSNSNDRPDKTPPSDRPSPNNGGSASKVSVKKEPPPSPSLRGTRHRPRKLDLSATSSAPRAPLTTREGNLAVQDVGLACLSPGFQTQDPAMREQLQRSVAVRDQQRSIIESRLQKSAKGEGPDGVKPSESNLLDPQPRTASKKKPPPAGLSIVPPSASQFANERTVQSAPLNQTFTGRRQPQPANRNYLSHPSELLSSTSSQIHHTPATQTNNRLPPISDVFGSEALGARDRERDGNGPNNGGLRPGHTAPHSNHLGPLPSPGQPGGNTAKRPREYRSAEEAVHELSGGREDLLPRIVHYSGSNTSSNQQPSTPPSSAGNQQPGVTSGNAGPPNGMHHHQHQQHLAPQPQPQQPQQQQQQQPHNYVLQQPPPAPTAASSTGTARRRARNEYEQDNGSPPLGAGPDNQFRRGGGQPSGTATFAPGPFGAGRDSPDTQRRKKEEFLGLCARAWDLFHS